LSTKIEIHPTTLLLAYSDRLMETWMPGVQLGPYELLSRIGSGGMSEVWKARDTRLGRLVAIKKLNAEHSKRFEPEARAIASLNHPHICHLYDIGPDYLVMEYIDGKPLSCPLPIEQALRLAVQIADALEEAHAHGIIHRDLKPANIMVTESGAAKLLDFGLARVVTNDWDVTRNTLDGAVVGTPAYLSPEQAQGKELDVRSDVFSFGAVLYEMLSGARAFPGESVAQILSAVMRDEPNVLQAPHPLDHIVKQCLRKQPADRFQAMTEVKAALEKVSTKEKSVDPSIAVLPFADMSPGKDNEYFSDGLAEEIINALAQVRGLRVIARTSAFAFKGQHTDIRRIAEALGVTNILEGSVRKAGTRIRVTAQLITASDGSHLWSQRYDRELTDVFAIQDEIGQAIAAALEVKLAGTGKAERHHTPSLPAYDAYLKGRHYWAKLTPDSLERSRMCYEQAIMLDPQFAAAHCSLGEYFFAMACNGLMPAREAMPQARQWAETALDIDPFLPGAHAVLGWVHGTYEFDWAGAGREFRLAMAQEPISPWVHSNYGLFYLLQVGHIREALEECECALQEDPLNLLFRANFAICLQAGGKSREASDQLRQILEIEDTFWLAYWWLGVIEASEGNVKDALAHAQKAYSLAPWDVMSIGLRAGILARTGELNEAEKLFADLNADTTAGVAVGWVVFHLACSEADKAMAWIEQAIEQRDIRVVFLMRTLLQSSSRWPVLAEMMNLRDAI
jgi:serine/threonine protein kinase/Tfp pilus assembly protein PilF